MVGRRGILCLVFLAGVGAALWLGLRSGDSHPERDLEAVAAVLRGGDDEFFGHAQVDALRRERARLPGEARNLSAADRHARIDIDLRLGGHGLRLGDVDAAIAAYDRALQDAAGDVELQRQLPDLHVRRGLAWLRRAERNNCIARHAPACCIWPLQGDGLHVDAEPASKALDDFLAALQAWPDDPAVRWLAHIAATACQRPERVPPAQRWPAAAPASAPQFVDRAPDLGVDSFDLCGGAAVVDVDGDADFDLVSTTWDPAGPMQLWRNQGNGTFAAGAAAAGLQRQVGGLNLVVADYDNDGDQDLFVLRGAWLMDRGQIRNSLLQNDGAGRFTDVTHRAGLADPARPTQTAVWGDFDDDGDLDLYVGNESRRELRNPPGGDYPNQLFRNNGDGTFTDVAAAAGVTNDRYCKGVCAGDYDNDGDLDLYVSNIAPQTDQGRNRLYRNDGGLRFVDVAEELGVTAPRGRSFACWFFDYDNDGWLDLFAAGFQAALGDIAADMLAQHGGKPAAGGERPRLYRNLGGRFADVTTAVGLDRVTLPMGANFCDYDADGWLDVYLATGNPGYEVLVPNLMFRNDGGRAFADTTIATGLGHLQKGHGVAFADIDGDGDQDLWHQLGGFYPDDGYYNALFENRGGGRLLSLELVGTRSNRDAVGARVRIDLDGPSGPRSLHRANGCVSSFGGSIRRVEVGLGDASTVARVVVRWPAGSTQEFTEVPAGGRVRLREGEAAPVVLPHAAVPFAGKPR